ncbi:hypothetical protein EU805_07805 [Salipiger sp. IMCC34102]|uniref:hypothetical protein n=1 Tax=Salipiger sp. IMCC34102 TaxID=2510647 RepID=UPI00101C70A9|nr:hypothetical protein [Salipiger sp. IMCC34102]RYH02523.1 hypothetical protein EU805_07805 [Salipiger sp. IMCC34102]
MPLDALSEKIAHFIGSFELLTDQIRARLDYDTFRAAQIAEREMQLLETPGIFHKHDYKLDGFDAELDYIVFPVSLMPVEVDHSIAFDPIFGSANLSELTVSEPVEARIEPVSVAPPLDPTKDPAVPDPAVPDPVVPNPAPPSVVHSLPAASSLATLTVQYNTFNDDDVFGSPAFADMQSVAALHAALDGLAETATTLSPIPADLDPATADWMQVLPRIVQAAEQVQEDVGHTLSETVMSGAQAKNVLLANGDLVTEKPDFDALLPRYLQDRKAETEVAKARSDFGPATAPDNDDSRAEDGNLIVTGANTLINTASVTSNWLDAPAIVVAGDVIRFDGISQVNLLVEHDQVSSTLRSPTETVGDSDDLNVATIGIAGRSANLPSPEGSDVASTLPSNWVIARLDGPVTQLNWVQQHNFTTDFDQASITLGGSGLFLGMGENGLSNSFEAFELGFQYDLIVANGDLIDVNLISQTNVLFDSDIVLGQDEFSGVALQTEPVSNDHDAGAAPGPANQVATVPAQEATAPVVSDRAIATEGTATVREGLSGIETSAPASPDDHPAEAANIAETDAATPAFSTSDNLLYNEAIIERIGAVTDAEMTQAFRDALAGLAEADAAMSDAIAQDELFHGTELLRVLYIDGDFTTVNVVDQVNILGDADQVHLARDEFADALQAQAEIVTGSNMLANVAAIRDIGVDSTIMAQGETYSDALIHQAELLDTEAVPSGAKISQLANEAVAFLADDLLGEELADTLSLPTEGHMADMPGSADIMQSVLA